MTLRILLMLSDGVSAALVFLLVSVARFRSDPAAVWSVGIDIGPAAAIFAVVWVAVLWATRMYNLRVRWSLVAEARDMGQATLAMVAVSLAALFILHQDNVSRVFLAFLFVAQPVSALFLRLVLNTWFERLRSKGRNLTYMLIAGTGEVAQEFANQVERHPSLGVKVIGHLSVPLQARRATDDPGSARAFHKILVSRPVIGSLDEMTEIFRSRVVDEVAVCLPQSSIHFLEPIIAVAADEGKTVRVPRDPEEGALTGALQEEFGGFLVRSIVHDGQRELERAAKRIMDVLGAAIGLVILSPFFLVAGAAIAIFDGTPILFRQTRVGRHGRLFTIHKFRTMSLDAEERYAELAALSDTKGAAFKMENDPRITRSGRILRKWTLDELPQLWNVLRGDMSLVGPRPAPPREVEAYDIWHRRRLSVRPGMTGLWQVQARFDYHFDDRAELDLRYIDQWSLWMDMAILLRTVPAVLTPRGR